jgi:flagellin-like protein
MEVKKMRTKKGISPILATVILIAVTLVIAVGVIGWVMGIWGSMGRTEMLSVTPIKLDSSNNELELLIINQGQITAKINKIIVEPLGECSTTDDTINPGDSRSITCTISEATINPGVVYTVKVITSSGNIYQTQVRAE